MPSTTAQKARYNRRVYDTILVRIRRDSALADRLAAHKLDGCSQNSLIIRLLSEYFGVENPQQWYEKRKVTLLYP